MMKNEKRNWILILTIFSIFFFTACTRRSKVDSKKEDIPRDTSTNYVVYEGVFLNSEDVLKMLEEIRGPKAPYENVSKEYHVTTMYKPEKDFRELYGSDVNVHIIGYLNGQATADDGTITHNEALVADLISDDPILADYLSSSQEGWHITCSYETKAFYSNLMDYSKAQKVDYTLSGKFGAYINGNFVSFDRNDVDTKIETNQKVQ